MHSQNDIEKHEKKKKWPQEPNPPTPINSALEVDGLNSDTKLKRGLPEEAKIGPLRKRPTARDNSVPSDNNDKRVNVPVLHTLKIDIEGTPVNLLLDNGATYTVCDESVLNKLERHVISLDDNPNFDNSLIQIKTKLKPNFRVHKKAFLLVKQYLKIRFSLNSLEWGGWASGGMDLFALWNEVLGIFRGETNANCHAFTSRYDSI